MEQRFMAAGKIEELALDAARILEAQHGAAGDGAALRFDRSAAERRERHRKRLTARAQGLDGLFHRGSSGGIQPTAKGEHAIRRRSADDRRIAVNAGLIGSRRPLHHDLRFRQQ